MNTLHAIRRTLEPTTAAHAAELFEALSDPAIYEFEGEPTPSLERLEGGLRRREARLTPDGKTILDWAVRTADSRIAGYVLGLLRKLGFVAGGTEDAEVHGATADETTLVKEAPRGGPQS
jgi:hypothetical protein